jgi:predicted dehydrogenase
VNEPGDAPSHARARDEGPIRQLRHSQRTSSDGQLSQHVEVGQGQTRLALEIGLKLAQERGVGPKQPVPRQQAPPARHLFRQDPIEVSSRVRFRKYLHMQSPENKILACASISTSPGSKVPPTEARETTSALAIPKSTLGVGIIGVNAAWGWAATAHIPALRALPNYEIRALSARSPESARAAGEAFGIKAVFPDHEQLVIQPDIDVVAVTVKVPHHRELVSAALAAGKAVYCEWPLGRDLDEARAMAALAAQQGVRTVVGLQARQAPAIEFVQQLLSDGYVGEVLSTSLVGLSVLGGTLVQPNAYMLDKTNGANLLTVAFGHSLDILNYVLGEFANLSAVSDLRRPLLTIEETGEQIVKTAVDQIAVIGTLTSGAIASVHIREAVAGGTGFLWEINGTDGTLRITADAALPEIYPLTVAGARGRNEPAELAIPAALTQKWPALVPLEGAPAFNVGRAYAAFAADIDNGTHTVPDFADAVRRHEVIAAIEKSAASGERVKL